MKKILAMVMAIVMMMAIAVPAFAADLSAKNTDSGEVTITTSIRDENGNDGDWYLVRIPADTTIAWGAPATEMKYYVEAHLLYGKTLDVDVTSADYKMTYAASATDSYDLEFALTGETDENFATVTYPEVEKTISVDITADAWNYAIVGEYADILTFSAAIV